MFLVSVISFNPTDPSVTGDRCATMSSIIKLQNFFVGKCHRTAGYRERHACVNCRLGRRTPIRPTGLMPGPEPLVGPGRFWSRSMQRRPAARQVPAAALSMPPEPSSPRFFILDVGTDDLRPSPLGGSSVDGRIMSSPFSSNRFHHPRDFRTPTTPVQSSPDLHCVP